MEYGITTAANITYTYICAGQSLEGPEIHPQQQLQQNLFLPVQTSYNLAILSGIYYK